ncbi:MAG TPA: transglutaminaseTgpA domain-containing protein [Candidatus Dormibacteraeota bacterium]
MEAWADRTVQLRETARARPAPIRNYTFEIGAMLCVALIAATAWAVLAAGWVNGGGGAAVVAVTSVIEAALLAQARAPRLVAAIAAPFLGLAAIVPTTLAAMTPVAGQSGGTIVSHYARALVTGLASTQDWDFTVGLCAVLFLCGYWLGWTALREHRGVLAVIPVFSVLATNVVNAKDPDPIAVPETVAVVLALAVIAAAHLGALSERWASARITPLHGMRVRFGASAAAMAVGLTVVALLLPAVSTTDISARLFPNGLSLGSSGKGVGHPGPGSGTATIGFSPSVELGGRLVSQPKTVLSYTTDSPATLYLAVAADTFFSGGNWFTPAGGAGSAPGKYTWTGVQYPGGLLPRDTNAQDGGVGSEGQTVRANIVLQPGATGQQPLVPFTGEPVSVNRAGIAYGTVADADQTSLLSVDSVALDRDLITETTIQTTAVISTATDAQLRAAGKNYPDFTKQYVSLSDDATHGVEAIRTLAAQWTAEQTNPYDQARAIEQHLRNPAFFQYTLNPPVIPRSQMWPVVYFLTTSHRGYCQYFASAMGSMLRSLGIPTRLVSGYGPGTTHDVNGPQAASGSSHEQIVTSSDAHSWVEAYFPGYGWIPFEPTPPSAQGNYQPFPRGASAVLTTPVPVQTTPQPSPAAKPGFAPGSNAQVGGSSTSRNGAPAVAVVALSSLAAVAVIAIVALLWLALPRSLRGAWRRVETLGLLSGMDRRRAETHTAFAARLALARPRAGPALGELATVTARAEFSAAGASVKDRALALRTWRRALLAAIRRPGRSPG